MVWRWPRADPGRASERRRRERTRAIARFGREKSLDMKVSTISAALGAALLLAGPAANAAPPALAKACAKDVKSRCRDGKPGGSKLAACMQKPFSELPT